MYIKTADKYFYFLDVEKHRKSLMKNMCSAGTVTEATSVFYTPTSDRGLLLAQFVLLNNDK